jgi:hypothetical protein
VITETVLDATMDALPSGHNVVAVERWRLQPGSVPMTRPPSTGVVVIAAESGEITANQAGIAHQLAAGEPFTLAAQEASLRASGPDEATAFMVTIYAGANNAGHASERWDVDPIAHAVDYPISTSADALPGGAGRIVLERLTLPPGSALPPQEANPLVWTGVGAGVLGLTLEGEHLPFRWKSGAERTFRPGQYLPPIQPGTHLTLRNAGEDPLILYRLTLTPRGTGGPTVGTLAP